MLTGRVPFWGSERDVLQQIESGRPELPPDCPADLGAIVERLLSRQPKARYASAGAIRDELSRWLDATRRTDPLPAPAQPWTPPPGLPPLLPPIPSLPTQRTTTPADATRRTSGAHDTAPADATRRTTARQMATDAATARIVRGADATSPAPAPAAAIPEPAAPAQPLPEWSALPASSAPVAAAASTAAATTPTPVRRHSRRSRLLVLLAASIALWIVWNVGREVRVWNESGLLGRRVLAAEPEALDDMWRTYGSLDQQSRFGFGTWPARGPLRLALVQHVDRSRRCARTSGSRRARGPHRRSSSAATRRFAPGS
jgi:hypothetical protein